MKINVSCLFSSASQHSRNDGGGECCSATSGNGTVVVGREEVFVGGGTRRCGQHEEVRDNNYTYKTIQNL